MSFGIIYKAVNKVNGKIYVGQTVRGLHERKRKHGYSQHETHFHRAIRKYGLDNFKWEILERCKNQNELNDREVHYINEYDSIKSGYNMVSGGGVMTGWQHSEETKRKLAKATKTRLDKNGHPNKGRKWSKEIRKRMSEGHKGFKPSERQRREHSKRMKGEGNPMYGMSGKLAPASKTYTVTDPDGNSFIVHGLHKFCKENNLNDSCMNRCAQGSYKQHKGYRCKYFDEVGS